MLCSITDRDYVFCNYSIYVDLSYSMRTWTMSVLTITVLPVPGDVQSLFTEGVNKSMKEVLPGGKGLD